MERQRQRHSGASKAKVALEALKAERALNELGGHFELHPTQVVRWKQRLVAGASDLFNGGVDREGWCGGWKTDWTIPMLDCDSSGVIAK